MGTAAFVVHVFGNERGMLALTGDAEGSSLPRMDGPWHFIKTAVLSNGTADERHAVKLIGIYGFCCFDEHPQKTSGE